MRGVVCVGWGRGWGGVGVGLVVEHPVNIRGWVLTPQQAARVLCGLSQEVDRLGWNWLCVWGEGGGGGYIELVVEHPVNMTKVRSGND